MRYKPARRNPNEDYSLLDTKTGKWYFEEQGFGVCDRAADDLNFNTGWLDEIGEQTDKIRKDRMRTPGGGAQ